METLKITIDNDEDTVIDLKDAPNAGLFLFCRRPPKGAPWIKMAYLSGFDVDNAEYAVEIDGILNAKWDNPLEQGGTSRDLLGPAWDAILEQLKPFAGMTAVISENPPLKKKHYGLLDLE